MTKSINVNNALKLVEITLTEEMLEDAYWLNVFYEHDDGEVGDVEEILLVSNCPWNFDYGAVLDAFNELNDCELNDYCESDEEYYEAGDKVWALVDNQSTILTHNA